MSSSDQDKTPLPDHLVWNVSEEMKVRMDYCLWRTRWEGITETASSARNGQPCRLLPQYRCLGGNRLERVVEFEDGTLWTAWVQLMEAHPNSIREFEDEVGTIAIAQRNDQNRAGAAFMLTEFLPGNSACVEAQSYPPDPTLLGVQVDAPPQFRDKFRRSVAAAHVQIASVRLPQIGTVTRDAGGNLVAGPIPGIGGPFDTAAAYFQALAANLEHPYSDDRIRASMARSRHAGFVEEMIKGQNEFPARLARLASSGKAFMSKGPFPVCHTDFSHYTTVVDEEFGVLGVFNWENARTVPWEMLEAPCSYNATPRYLSDLLGSMPQPQEVHSFHIRQSADEREYTAMVREAELDAQADHRLSDALADKDMRDLAQMLDSFRQGRIGVFGRGMDYLENKYLG